MKILLLHDEAFFARIIDLKLAGNSAIDEARDHIEQGWFAAAAQSNDARQLEVIEGTRNSFENFFCAFILFRAITKKSFFYFYIFLSTCHTYVCMRLFLFIFHFTTPEILSLHSILFYYYSLFLMTPWLAV